MALSDLLKSTHGIRNSSLPEIFTMLVDLLSDSQSYVVSEAIKWYAIDY